MFERYTEKARRVIFFARYEASQFGSPYIETEHLLLGLLREDKALTNRFLRSHASVESIRKQIEAHTTIREKVSTSVDLPLSNECKRVLAYAAEEAEQVQQAEVEGHRGPSSVEGFRRPRPESCRSWPARSSDRCCARKCPGCRRPRSPACPSPRTRRSPPCRGRRSRRPSPP